jgi:hypothetical protein
MAARIGLRISPESGSLVMGIPFGGGLGGGSTPAFQRDGEPSFVLDPGTLLDAGGGTFDFIPNGGYCLMRTVSAAEPWEVWFSIEPGHYIHASGDIQLASEDAMPDRARVHALYDDGVSAETVFNSLNWIVSNDPGWYAWFSESVDFTVGGVPPDYQNFWTDFIKTRENAP